MKNLVTLISIVFFLLIVSADDKKGDLKVTVNGLKIEGTVYLSLFNKADGYPMDAEKAIKKNMKKVSSGQEKFVFKDLPYGVYAVSVWHDQNDNGKMDTNLIGIPKEGTAASNNAKGKMGPPKFKDASFKIEKKSHNISIKINY